MLTESQLDDVWRDMLGAEARSYYYGDLAARTVRNKRWITAVNAFLASGAAVAFLARQTAWLASGCALLVAGLSAYSLAANPDATVSTLIRLQSMWQRIQNEYEHLWNHTWAEDAERVLAAIQDREREASALFPQVPYRPDLVEKWQDQVNRLHAQDPQQVA